MKKLRFSVKFFGILFFLSSIKFTYAQNQPTFNSDPKPSGKQWVKVQNLSDEFNDGNLDTNKWRTTSSGNWIGRPPGLFLESNVTEANNNLRITATKFSSPRFVSGQRFTYGGGYVESNNPAKVGYYLECKMRANKTFMSSTFWLNNKSFEGVGCDKRTTELDIQECVGTVTGTSPLALRGGGWDQIMHSNAHSRNVACASTPTGSSPKYRNIGANVAEDYHVYGAWWKSPREVICYLDGKEWQTVIPKADFNLDLFLRLVVETYDWNPVPTNGQAGDVVGSFRDRSTYYDWVRVWRLQNAPNGGGGNNQTFHIQNRATGKFIRPQIDVPNGIIAQAPSIWKGKWTQWDAINVNGTYFHLKNKQTGKYLRPENTSINSPMIQSTTAVNSQWQTQWKKVNASNGFFYLENRWTGKYFRPIGNDDLSTSTGNNYGMQLKPQTFSGSFTQWKFVNVGSSKRDNLKDKITTEEVSFNFYPNPASNIINIKTGANNYNVKIHDISGRLVKSVNINKNTTKEVNVSNFNSGIYLMRYKASNGDKISTEKLIVK